MTIIHIGREDLWCYNFFTSKSDPDIWNAPQRNCSCCNVHLSVVYSYIIDNLKEAKLLPEDYKEICCYCHTLQKFGLIGLKDYLSAIIYSISTDILTISFFTTSSIVDGIKERIKKQVNFYVHDYSKIAEA